MTMSVALFACLHCIDEFAFDHRRIANLGYGWCVRVRCPGCGNIVAVVMLAYSVIHGCDPEKYQSGQILEILPPDPKTAEESIRRNIQLHYEIYQKRSNWRPG